MSESKLPPQESQGGDPNFQNRPRQRPVDEPTFAEKAVSVATEQAAIAAGAIRRGEIMQGATDDPAASDDDKVIALLCYMSQAVFPFLLPILVLISASSKRSAFQRYHAVQSFALSAVFAGLGLAVLVTIAVLQIVPIIGGLAWSLLCLFPIAMLMYWSAHLYYGLHAWQGRRFSIPGLTEKLQERGWMP